MIMPELTHIIDKNIKEKVEKLIDDYEPKQVKESPIELKLILTELTSSLSTC